MLTSGGRKQLEYLEFGWRLSIVNIWISKANKGVADHFIYLCIFLSSGAHERAPDVRGRALLRTKSCASTEVFVFVCFFSFLFLFCICGTEKAPVCALCLFGGGGRARLCVRSDRRGLSSPHLVIKSSCWKSARWGPVNLHG